MAISKSTYSASNLNSPLQVHWEKKSQKYSTGFWAISQPILAQNGPYEPSTTLVCWISLVQPLVPGWKGYSWICWKSKILPILQIHDEYPCHPGTWGCTKLIQHAGIVDGSLRQKMIQKWFQKPVLYVFLSFIFHIQ